MASNQQKAMAPARIFHLIGDARQPPHTTSLFMTLFPTGDGGDTRFSSGSNQDSAAIKPHER